MRVSGSLVTSQRQTQVGNRQRIRRVPVGHRALRAGGCPIVSKESGMHAPQQTLQLGTRVNIPSRTCLALESPP